MIVLGLGKRYIEHNFSGGNLLAGRSLIISDQELAEFAQANHATNLTKDQIIDMVFKSRTLSLCL